MGRLLNLVALAILILGIFVFPATTDATTNKKVGIWYSAWHSNEAKYDWLSGYGVGATYKFLRDINHDNKSDALMYWDTSTPGFRGRLDVALANGSGTNFSSPPQTWLPDLSHAGASKVFFEDVNNDDNADIIQYFARNPSECTWVVALSNGVNGFGGFSIWHGGHGCGSNDQLVGDVTGDGKADAVVFFNDYGSPGFRGSWYVANSTGSDFSGGNPNQSWINEFGQGSGKRFLADVTGDGAADAVTYTDNAIDRGNWWAAQSNGVNAFTNPHNWAQGHGYQSNSQALGDVDADGKADAVVYFSSFGGGDARWYKAPSNGSTFQTPNEDTIWKLSHGNWSKSSLSPSALVGLGNVDGDINGSGYGTADPVVFHEYYKNGEGAGKWRAVTKGDTYTVPEAMNIWDAYEIKYRPLINGQPGIYDTKTDTSVVDVDIQRIDQAGMDYLLIDLTNNLPGWITDRAKIVCQRIAAYNATGHSLKFAIATGGSQWKAYNDVAIVEDEAAYVKTNFVDDATCGPHYFQWQGKPLLANYFKDTAQKNFWQNQYPNKTATPNFTMKYVFGELPHLKDSGLDVSPYFPYPSYSGSECGNFPVTGGGGNPIYPVAGEYGDYLGWGLPYGSADPGTGRTMVVQPGWNNHDPGTTRKIARTQNSVPGGFYTTCTWNRVQANKSLTDMVVINSYNEYAEETAVAPTDTSAVLNDPPGAQWPSTNFYWDLTVSNVAQFKN